MATVNQVIAEAIQKADNSYFFENYSKQAREVRSALAEAGFVLVPIDPTDDMVKAGSAAIVKGNVRTSAHTKRIYQQMIAAFKI